MMKVVLYINNQIVDFYDDEVVSINSSVQNVRDITKIFSDFSQSFKVPASPKNNKIFKHYYNVDIVGGFDARKRTDAKIELSGLPFKDGRIELESVTMKGGKAIEYKLTFYSNLVRLSDLFGDDKLSDLDLSAYDHSYARQSIIQGLIGYTGLTSNSIIYPLALQRGVSYNSQGTTLADTDIKFNNSVQDYGLSFTDFKPSLRIESIITAIQSKYGFTFNSNFLASNKFTNLFMWLSNSKESVKCNEETDIVSMASSSTSPTSSTWVQSNGIYISNGANNIRFTIENTEATNKAEYRVDFVDVSSGNVVATSTKKSDADFNGTILEYTTSGGQQIKINITSDSSFSYKSQLFDVAVPSTSYQLKAESFNYLNAHIYFDCEISISKNIPDISVVDFLTGIFKMFNLTIVPDGMNYLVEPLDDYYSLGKDVDITRFVDWDKINIDVPPVSNEIEFKYDECETATSERYREANERGYGDAKVQLDLDGGTTTFSIPFENVLLERMSDATDGGLTDVQVGKIVDDKNEGINIGVYVHYKSDFAISSSNSIALLNDSGSTSSFTRYWFSGSTLKSSLNGTEIQSMNFDIEVNPYTFTNDTETLYSNFYEDYITDTYSQKRRLYSISAILPIGKILNLNLNDRVVINGTKFLINTMQTNLITGEVKFKLLNDV